MATKWYCMINEEERGPLDSSQLVDLAKSGLITPSDWLRPDGDDTWVPAARIKGLFEAPASSAPLAGAKTGAGGETEVKVKAGVGVQAEVGVQAGAKSATPSLVAIETEEPASIKPIKARAATSHKSQSRSKASHKTPTRHTAKPQRDNTAWKIVGVLTAIAAVTVLITWIMNRPRDEDASNEPETRRADQSAANTPHASSASENTISSRVPDLRARAPQGEIELDGLTIRVTGVEHSRPSFVREDGRRGRSTAKSYVIDLVISLEEEATSPVRYLGWGRSIRENQGIDLTDEMQNLYKIPQDWRGDIEQQAIDEQEIGPGQIITDRLVFSSAIETNPVQLTIRLPTASLVRVAASTDVVEDESPAPFDTGDLPEGEPPIAWTDPFVVEDPGSSPSDPGEGNAQDASLITGDLLADLSSWAEAARNDPSARPEYIIFELPAEIIETPEEESGLRVLETLGGFE